MRMKRCAAALVAVWMFGSASAGSVNYQTKTPYQPQQEMAAYEAAPAGYVPVSTQLLARHGSRGLTGFKADLALYNMWLQAQQDDALTPLGRQLGPDILVLMRANFTLGHGVPGISKPGYGNETMQGIAEHTALARRMVARLPALFAATTGQVVVVTSGRDRAVDSGAVFVRSLLAERPALAAAVVYPPSRAARGEVDHATRPAGTDRFLLYFHKLDKKRDRVTDPADPLYRTYQASQAYQAYEKSAAVDEKEAAVLRHPQLLDASRATLARLFAPAFLEKLDRGQLQFANTGTRTFASADGRFSNTLSGDGKTRIASSVDAAMMLYALYGAAADMQAEVAADFTRYVLPAQANVFAYVSDAEDFYSKGPGMVDQDGVTWRMAQTLKEDFLQEIDAIANGNLAHLIKLRFAHAETIIPFAAMLGIPGMSEPLPPATLYTYQNSAWRGAMVAPMAANIQWDVYRNTEGAVALRMLYNERETDFAPVCDSARVAPGSHFYVYAALKACLQ